ncbi:MAG: leucine-rich repeat domain-containing protein [Eubacterium sp.]|nr:leucine-rich repeat domain-containing protein [Eubacterium sp.]
MYENSDKTISTVEWVASQEKLYVRNFDKNLNEQDATVLDAPLPIFGGFFSGKSYNFAVFGQKNDKDSDDVEVIRIVRYSKDYKTKKELPIKAINTYIPFDAGSLRMDEAGGKLYIHTCHEMYESEDGYHHQANMTFVIDESAMTVLDKYSDVMNIAQAGYVSHSFNQFIRTDGTYIYRSDHGDANPRGITLTRAKVGDKITKVIYVVPLSIQVGSYGYNATGASLGGLQLSSSNVLVTGNSVDQTQESVSGSRNIFMTISNKDFTTYDIKWFTKFKINGDTTARTPHLVKLNDEQFLLMWEEYNSKTDKTITKIATVGAQGDLVDTVSTNLRLSDCEPVVTSDGLVRWFVTDYNKLQIISINPYNLSAVTGAVSVDKTVDDYAKDGGQFEKDVVIPGDTKLKKGTKIKVKGKVLYTVTGDGTLEYTGNSSLKGKVTIPATYKYNGVVWKITSIADNAFKNNKKITSVVIGDNVKTIGKNAFRGCKKLKKVTIGKSVTKIGAYAFYGCKSLKSIIIKSSKLKTVGKNAIKKIHKKAVIKVPKKKYKAYKKLFNKKTGFKKPMKIKKK